MQGNDTETRGGNWRGLKPRKGRADIEKPPIPSKETGLVSDFIQLSDPCCEYIEHPVIFPVILPLPKKAFLLWWPPFSHY